MTMISPAIDYNKYPLIQDKDDAFKALITEFILELQALSPKQKSILGLFKAIELTNAAVQTLEKENAPESLGEAKAITLFNLVRTAIRNRYLNLPDGSYISLKDTQLKLLIDRACVMFHAGKKDPEQKAKAIAFSMAQSIVLHTEIKQGIADFSAYYPELHTPQIMQIVKDKYFQPFVLS